MASLLFLLTFLTLIVLLVILMIKAFRHRPVKKTVRSIAFIALGYAIIWQVLNLISKDVPVPLGTDSCFDDWCATVIKTENGPAVQNQFSALHTDSTYIILHIRMSNHARGIAQKPSEPRVHLLDDKGRARAYSANGQQLFEKQKGGQPGISHRLELGQSMETIMVFAFPRQSKGLKALIEEGPWITNLIFPDDRQVFAVSN